MSHQRFEQRRRPKPQEPNPCLSEAVELIDGMETEARQEALAVFLEKMIRYREQMWPGKETDFGYSLTHPKAGEARRRLAEKTAANLCRRPDKWLGINAVITSADVITGSIMQTMAKEIERLELEREKDTPLLSAESITQDEPVPESEAEQYLPQKKPKITINKPKKIISPRAELARKRREVTFEPGYFDNQDNLNHDLAAFAADASRKAGKIIDIDHLTTENMPKCNAPCANGAEVNGITYVNRALIAYGLARNSREAKSMLKRGILEITSKAAMINHVEEVEQLLAGKSHSHKVEVVSSASEAATSILLKLGIEQNIQGLQYIAKTAEVLLPDSDHHKHPDLPRIRVIAEILSSLGVKYSIIYGDDNKKGKLGYVAVLIGEISEAEFPKKVILVNNELHNATFVIHGIKERRINWDEFVALDRNDLKRLQPDIVSSVTEINQFSIWQKTIAEILQQPQLAHDVELAQILEQRRAYVREEGEMTKNQFRKMYHRPTGGERFEKEFNNAVIAMAAARGIPPLLITRFLPDEKGTVAAHYPKEIGAILKIKLADRKIEIETDRITLREIDRMIHRRGVKVSRDIIIREAEEKARKHSDFLKDHPDAIKQSKIGNQQVLTTFSLKLAEMIVDDFIEERKLQSSPSI